MHVPHEAIAERVVIHDGVEIGHVLEHVILEERRRGHRARQGHGVDLDLALFLVIGQDSSHE